MSGVHLDAAVVNKLAQDPGVLATCVKAAGRIADAVRSQGILVGDRDGGQSEYPLPVRVLPGASRDSNLVQYTTQAGNVRVATRAQALAWGGSFSEISGGGGDTVVLIAHPSGVATQAKHGVLTRAAATAGFEVRS